MINNTKEKKDIIERIGNPEDIDRDLQSFRKSAMLLSSKHPRLIDTYENQWVAVYEGNPVASGATLPLVLEKVDKKGIPRENVIVRYIDRKPRTMILSHT